MAKGRVIEDDDVKVDLTLSTEKVCFLILKAREFDVKDEETDPDSGSNPTDDMDASILEDHGDDPVVDEITALIEEMSIDEQVDLVAIAWLGRGDGGAADWSSIRAEAAQAHNGKTATYLLGMPQLGDFLEEGLALLGRSCVDSDVD